jgi:hypothetical protein
MISSVHKKCSFKTKARPVRNQSGLVLHGKLQPEQCQPEGSKCFPLLASVPMHTHRQSVAIKLTSEFCLLHVRPRVCTAELANLKSTNNATTGMLTGPIERSEFIQ